MVGFSHISSKGKRKAEGESTSEAENNAKVKSNNVSRNFGFMNKYNISPDWKFKKDKNIRENLVSRGGSKNSWNHVFYLAYSSYFFFLQMVSYYNIVGVKKN